MINKLRSKQRSLEKSKFSKFKILSLTFSKSVNFDMKQNISFKKKKKKKFSNSRNIKKTKKIVKSIKNVKDELKSIFIDRKKDLKIESKKKSKKLIKEKKKLKIKKRINRIKNKEAKEKNIIFFKSKRNQLIFPIYKNEQKKIIFKNKKHDKLNIIHKDEDNTTDDEILESSIKKILNFFP